MDNPLTNTADRNFVKYCIALQSLKEALSTFIKKQSEELSYRNLEDIKRKCGVSVHTCRECNLRLSGEKCASSNICAPCDVLYQRITKMHLTGHPNWSNAKWELLSSSPWQQIKCYISDRGYKVVSGIEEAVISAFVQICCNHRELKHMVREIDLQKIVDTLDDVFTSEQVLLTDEDLQQHIQDIKAVLQIECLHSTTDIQTHVDVIEKLLIDERTFVIEDEIIARHGVISHLNRSIASLEYLHNETEASGNDYTARIVKLSSIKQRQCKQLQTRFEEIESFINKLKKECKTHEEKLLKHRTEASKLGLTEPLRSSAVGAIGLRTDIDSYKWYMKLLQEQTCDDVIEVLNGIDKNDRSIKQVDRSINQVEDAVRLINSSLRDHFAILQCERDKIAALLLKVTTVGAQDNDALSNEMVSAGNAVRNGDIPTDARASQMQHILRDLFQNLEQGGNTIRRVSHGCMAIYISCPTVNNLLALCEDFFSGKLTALIKPLQEYLRSSTGCNELSVVINIFEKDYLNCIMPIMNEVKHKLDMRRQAMVSLTPDVNEYTLQKVPEHRTPLPDEHANNQADNCAVELSTAEFEISKDTTRPILHQMDILQQLNTKPGGLQSMSRELYGDADVKYDVNQSVHVIRGTKCVQSFDCMMRYAYSEVCIQKELLFQANDAGEYNVSKLTKSVSDMSAVLKAKRDYIMSTQSEIYSDIEKCRTRLREKQNNLQRFVNTVLWMERETHELESYILRLEGEIRELDDNAGKLESRAREIDREAEEKTGWGIGGIFMAAAGVMLAPVSFGLSLTLTATGGILAGVNLSNAADCRNGALRARNSAWEKRNESSGLSLRKIEMQNEIRENVLNIRSTNTDIETITSEERTLQRMIDEMYECVTIIDKVLNVLQEAETTLKEVQLNSASFSDMKNAFLQNPTEAAEMSQRHLETLKAKWEEMETILSRHGINPRKAF